MRMKEDHMRNGQLKPGYNVQIATSGSYVIDYGIFPNPTDTRTFIPQLESFREKHGAYPKRVIGDAGYGSEENLAWLERIGVEPLIKYATFDRERRRIRRTDLFKAEYWPYDPETDRYTCPEGQALTFTREEHTRNESGFAQTIRSYACVSCDGCPRRTACTRGAGNRTVGRNETMLRLRERTRRLLTSEEGKALRKRRSVEVETVFGELKSNRGFKRFLLRGKRKVSVEWGLLAIGHNLRKAALATN